VKFADQMPRFPGCEDSNASVEEKYRCAEEKLLSYIFDRVKYPKAAKDNGISGKVVVQFVVGIDGRIADTRIVRDAGGGCGDEVLRVVSEMNEMKAPWTPGRHRGLPVSVWFTLPVNFELGH
jgi:protein TonB